MKLFPFTFVFAIATSILFSSDSLKVGMELTYPPFETIDKSGKPAGISVEFCQKLAAYLGKNLIIENIPFTGLIPALQSNKIDLIMSSMTVTEERKKSIDFSDPYIRAGLCLLVSKNSPIQDIKEADDKNRTIVVKLGTTGQVYAQKHLKSAKILVLEKESACILEVVQGKADAFIYDQFSIFSDWKKNPNTTRALLKPFSLEPWAIGIRKNNEALLIRVNTFIKEFREKGGMDELADKYLHDQKVAFKQLGIPFLY